MSKQTESKQEQLARKCELSLVNCEDANGNTPLSEAAAGGHIHTISMLLLKGGEVNSRGRYDRTPLWRAAFAGHEEAVQVYHSSGFQYFKRFCGVTRNRCSLVLTGYANILCH